MRVPGCLAIAVLGIFLVSGCGKKIDTNKTSQQIRAEVESMTLPQLEAEAKAYIKEIMRTRAAFDKVKGKLQALPPQEMFSEKSRALQKEMTDITRQVSELTERYQIYAEKYEELGGDPAKIKAS